MWSLYYEVRGMVLRIISGACTARKIQPPVGASWWERASVVGATDDG